MKKNSEITWKTLGRKLSVGKSANGKISIVRRVATMSIKTQRESYESRIKDKESINNQMPISPNPNMPIPKKNKPKKY